jgi:hypothetical protein
MVGKKKPWQPPKTWQPLKSWRPHEWAPMREAWRRVDDAGGGFLSLTQHNLLQDFRQGRLTMAVRRFAADGTETCFTLKRTAWKSLKVKYAWAIEGIDVLEGEDWYYFVRRRELDRYYPAAAPTIEQREQPTKRNGGSKQPAEDKPRRKGSRTQDAIKQIVAQKWPADMSISKMVRL